MYFDAVDEAKNDKLPNEVWRPVFDARANRIVWPTQFALAGLNAQINHDLPLAIIQTCKERGTSPDDEQVHADFLKVAEQLSKAEEQVRAEYEPALLKLSEDQAGGLKHILGSFSVTGAQESAWTSTYVLWAQRNNTMMYGLTLRSQEQSVATNSRLLVIPIGAMPD